MEILQKVNKIMREESWLERRRKRSAAVLNGERLHIAQTNYAASMRMKFSIEPSSP
jgi:hypothetical protein